MLASFLNHVTAALALLAPGDARTTIEFTEDSLEVVARNIEKKKAVLVDVRSQEEWKKGSIAGAVFIPIDSLRKHRLDPKKLAKQLPRKRILYTYCVVGMRAKAAAKILQQQGYTVRALKPGYEELLEAGFKKAEPDAKEDKQPSPEPAAKQDEDSR